MATGASHQVERVGVFTPKQQILDRLGPARSLHHRWHQDGGGLPDRRHHHRGTPPGAERFPDSSRCSPSCSAACSRRIRRSTNIFAIARQAAAQRRQLRVRAGDVGRAGLRVPLRVPGMLHLEIIQERLGARIRSRPDLDRAIGRVPRPSHQRRGAESAQSGRHAGPGAHHHIEEPWIKATILVPDTHLGDILKLCENGRNAGRSDLCRQSRHGDLPAAAKRGGVRFLRPAQIGKPRYASFDYQIDSYQEGEWFCSTFW